MLNGIFALRREIAECFQEDSIFLKNVVKSSVLLIIVVDKINLEFLFMMRFHSQQIRELYQDLIKDNVEQLVSKKNYISQLILNVTSCCNMNCHYCYTAQGTYSRHEQKIMSPDDGVSYVGNILSKYDYVEQIKFFGGEPLLNFECIEAICSFVNDQYLKGYINNKPDFHINTNLTLNVESLNLLNKQFGLTITVGIDGPLSVHNSQRIFANGKGTFEIVNRNIKWLIDKCHQPRSLEVVFTDEHLRQGMTPIDIHLYLNEQYGRRNIIIHPKVPVLVFNRTRRNNNYWWGLTNRKMRKLFYKYGTFLVNDTLDNDGEIGLKRLISDTFSTKDTDYYCNAAIGYLAILPSGEIYPCAGFCGNQKFLMGNANDLELKNNIFLGVKQYFIGVKKKENKLCRTCDIIDTCVNCMAAMLYENCVFNSPLESICAFNMGITEGIINGINKIK